MNLAENSLEYLRAWIGREETSTDVIAVELVRRFNATFDIAADDPINGDVAPCLIHYCLSQPAVPTGLLEGDGHPQKGGFLPPVSLPRRMWAGSDLIFHSNLHIGEMVTRRSRIGDVTFKQGRSGKLCFVTVEHGSKVGERLAIEECQYLVYREAAAADDALEAAAPISIAPTGGARRPVSVNQTLLFRYSALTFNGHRIHYDFPYATNIEHYHGLVVHGPLQATWLLNFACCLKGSVPNKFIFRGQSPLFDHDTVSLHAEDIDSGLRLWTAREGGPVALSAEAIWDEA